MMSGKSLEKFVQEIVSSIAMAKPTGRFLPAGIRSMDKAVHSLGAFRCLPAIKETMAVFSARNNVVQDLVGPLQSGCLSRLLAEMSIGSLVMANK